MSSYESYKQVFEEDQRTITAQAKRIGELEDELRRHREMLTNTIPGYLANELRVRFEQPPLSEAQLVEQTVALVREVQERLKEKKLIDDYEIEIDEHGRVTVTQVRQ